VPHLSPVVSRLSPVSCRVCRVSCRTCRLWCRVRRNSILFACNHLRPLSRKIASRDTRDSRLSPLRWGDSSTSEGQRGYARCRPHAAQRRKGDTTRRRSKHNRSAIAYRATVSCRGARSANLGGGGLVPLAAKCCWRDARAIRRRNSLRSGASDRCTPLMKKRQSPLFATRITFESRRLLSRLCSSLKISRSADCT
jgi:hypothetical protein